MRDIALIKDTKSTRLLKFSNPKYIIRAQTLSEVLPALLHIEQAITELFGLLKKANDGTYAKYVDKKIVSDMTKLIKKLSDEQEDKKE